MCLLVFSIQERNILLNSIRSLIRAFKVKSYLKDRVLLNTQISRIEINVINIRKICSKKSPFNGILTIAFKSDFFRKVTSPRPQGFVKLLIGREVVTQCYSIFFLKVLYGYTEYNITQFSRLVP